MENTLSSTDSKKIEAAVKEFEAKTHAEILPVVLSRSDDYPAIRWRVAVSFAILLTALSFYFTSEMFLSPYLILISQFLWLFLGYLIASVPLLQRFFLFEEKAAEEVRQRAYEIFLTHNVHRTKNRSGILILVSLLEHRAEIVADIGYHEKVTQNEWNSIMDAMLTEAKAGRLTDGILQGIQDCQRIAEEQFPLEGKKANDVRDRPIVSDK